MEFDMKLSNDFLKIKTELPLLSDWLVKLYSNARKLTPSDFKSYFFDHLNRIIPFDSALWASRSDILNTAKEFWVEDTYLYHQPSDFMENYFNIASTSEKPDQLNLYLTKNPNKYFTTWDVIPKKEWEKTEIYSHHCKKYGVENILATLNAPDEYSTIGHAISLYRADANNLFTLEEKALINELGPNFIQSFKVNIVNSFAVSVNGNSTAKAIIDRYGEIIYEAEESFYFLAYQLKIIFNGKMTLDGLNTLSSQMEWKIDNYTITAYLNNGLIFIEISIPPIKDILTDRQLEISALISKGYTNIEIAKFLGIKKKTVDTHIGNILTMLNVRSRAAVTSLYLQQSK